MAPQARRPSRRNHRHGLFASAATLVVLAGAGAGAWVAARTAADVIEQRTTAEVRAALDVAGLDWARVNSDGLQVTLTGTAADEITRFRAVEQAGSVIDARRIVDLIEVETPKPVAPPPFSVELLRNGSGVSLIGLVPAVTDRQALVARLTRTAPDDAEVTDLLESADHPAPPGWDNALQFGVKAAELTGSAKVSIAAGQVSVTAITDSAEEKARLEATLERDTPEGVTLLTQISAPRPVISPFALRFVIDDEGARLEACTADSEEARAHILEAAAAAGAPGQLACTLGLGAPTPAWGAAAVLAISALGELGKGAVTLSDADISLRARPDVAQADFDAQVARLEDGLPATFALDATLEKPDAPPVQVEFTAERGDDGIVTLRGGITDERMREAVESLAQARFAHIDSALRVDPEVPAGWTVRVIAALEAMAGLRDGKVLVTPDLVQIEGVSGSENAAEAAAAALAARLGAGARYALAISYDPHLDEDLALPDGEVCVDRANAVLAQAEIGFSPGGAVIEGDIQPTLEALAEALQSCGDFRIEVGGHTDSQGSEELNATLSEERARAVLDAMASGGTDITHMTATGYGESRPVESNETEAGRDANRRIEFRLLAPDPVGLAEPLPAAIVSGVTAAAQGGLAPGQIAGTGRLGRLGDVADTVAASLPEGSPARSDAASPGSLWSGGFGGELRIETTAPPALGGPVPDEGPMVSGPDSGYTDDDRPSPRPDL